MAEPAVRPFWAALWDRRNLSIWLGLKDFGHALPAEMVRHELSMSVVLSGAWIAQWLGVGLLALSLLGIAVLLVGRLLQASQPGSAPAWGKMNLAPLPIRWLAAMTHRPVPVPVFAPTAPRAPPAVRPGICQPPPGFTRRRRVAAPPGPDPR